MVTRQLALFGHDPLLEPAAKVEADDVAWSYTRRSCLERCARLYYHDYYGASQRTASSDPNKTRLRLLKSLDSCQARAGTLLHRGIKLYLEAAQRGEARGIEGVIAWSRRLFRADQRHSRVFSGGSPGDAKLPPTPLREYYYCQSDADDRYAAAESSLVEALRAFAAEPQYATFRLGGSRPTALIERHVTLVGLPCRAEGKIDLAWEHLGTPTVVDWKLGQESGAGDASLQLAVYALWAVQHFACPPEMVRLYTVHFGSGTVVDHRVDDRLLAAARARIFQDVERMLSLHDYGQRAVANAFTPCGQPAVCRGCAYEAICYPGEGASRA